MRVGTRSLLFGVHHWLLHPLMVAEAWRRLYGARSMFSLPLWVAFIVHDWGYWGCSDMDGKEGKRHPVRGAEIMRALFGLRWGQFCLLHSRSFAKSMGSAPSRLALADKLATAVYPVGLYLWLAEFSGELEEYLGNCCGDANQFGLTKEGEGGRIRYWAECAVRADDADQKEAYQFACEEWFTNLQRLHESWVVRERATEVEQAVRSELTGRNL